MPTIDQIPTAPLVLDGHEVRYFAIRIPANQCYAEKILLIAMPGATDAQPKIVGSIVATLMEYGKKFPDMIDWIEVDEEYRRKGIGTQLWNLAEEFTGKRFEHNPVTEAGDKFAASFEE